MPYNRDARSSEGSLQVLKKRGVALFGAAGAWMLPAAVVHFFWSGCRSRLQRWGTGVSLAAGALAGRKVGFMESMAGGGFAIGADSQGVRMVEWPPSSADAATLP